MVNTAAKTVTQFELAECETRTNDGIIARLNKYNEPIDNLQSRNENRYVFRTGLARFCVFVCVCRDCECYELNYPHVSSNINNLNPPAAKLYIRLVCKTIHSTRDSYEGTMLRDRCKMDYSTYLTLVFISGKGSSFASPIFLNSF